VTIKVDLGALKVLVEAHGSRVGFDHPDDERFTLGPLGGITLTPLASM
jgi:hypothetical protein